MRVRNAIIVCFVLGAAVGQRVFAADEPLTPAQRRATDAIYEYFRINTQRLAERALADVETLEDWKKLRGELRRQLMEMLGLWPQPEKTDLKAKVTGVVQRDGVVVEKLHFQSVPGLYVTANFYRPKKVDQPLPTILYLCGHARVKVDGVSLGNKTAYQHHPDWFARHGYCSLIIDTLQLGEIEGIHHGTYRYGMWWWYARGYTPAGVEAWNSVRALDYLETRPEVDMKRIGVTGRSGGGTGTWWLAAIDDRPACLVPVAGITDIENHVVDGCITGHCDCNYYGNIYGFDTPMYAALAAPRPLLLSNSDKDRIFPLDGVLRVHSKLKRIYELYDASDRLGLLITEGPHGDTQQLRVPAFKWMNRWLRESDEPIAEIAEKRYDPKELKVFETLPADERDTTIQETFVAKAPAPEPPGSLGDWQAQRADWLERLRTKSLSGWPAKAPPMNLKTVATKTAKGLRLSVLELTSDENLRIPVYVVRGEKHADPSLLVVTVVDQEGWKEWLSTQAPAFAADLPGGESVESDAEAFDAQRKTLEGFDWAFATVAPRGIGPNQWDQNERTRTHIRRRFPVLGKTLDEGRIWDMRRAIAALESLDDYKDARVWVQGTGVAAGIALYAGLCEPSVERFDLHRPTTSHRDGPILLHVLKTLDMPQALALAFPRKVIVYDSDAKAWEWPAAVARLYNGKDSPLQFRTTSDAKSD